MPTPKLERVTSLLRDRIRDAAEMGALKSGSRLPGTRQLADELEVDPRLVSLAFRRLQSEGLVEVRSRSGIYLSEGLNGATAPALPRDWAIEMIAQAVERGVPAHRVSAAVEALTETHKLRAAVIAATSDQAVGIVRELQEDYGIAAGVVFPEQIAAGRYPATLLRSQLIVSTGELGVGLPPLAASLGKPLLVVRVRQDLFSEDWIAFMNGPVYVIVADSRFRVLLQRVLQPVPGSRNVTILVAGRDDMSRVPREARTYVTESARRMLRVGDLPGRVIRPRRVFSSETVREVVGFLAGHNARKKSGPTAG